MLNRDRETCIGVAREMKIDEELAREIMTYNVYSMEMNDKIVKGMNEFVDFLYASTGSSRSSPPSRSSTRKIPRRSTRSREVESKTDVKCPQRFGAPAAAVGAPPRTPAPDPQRVVEARAVVSRRWSP